MKWLGRRKDAAVDTLHGGTHMLSAPAAQSGIALDDVCFVARRILAMVKDPRTNAERLARVVDSVESLSDMVVGEANELFAERGEVAATSMAITVIGFNRLEAITRRFLFLEFERLSTVSAFEEPSLFEVSAPDAPSVGRLSSRYAALG